MDTRPGNAEGTTPAATAYTLEVDGGLILSVMFSEAATADYSAEGLNLVADSLFEQLGMRGGENAATGYREHTTVNGHPALDCRISFTARNGKKTIWFARIIGNGTRAVHLQSIGSSTPEAQDDATEVIGQYHQLLVDNVHVP